MNDQCLAYGAPCSIQRLSISFCSGLSTRCESGGGIISDSSVDVMRRQSSLWSGWPGTIAVTSSCLAYGRFGLIEPQLGLPGFLIEAVALEAVFGEDRADVAVEIEFLFGGGRERWNCCESQDN